jgi:endo-1,4-beta-xylanase
MLLFAVGQTHRDDFDSQRLAINPPTPFTTQLQPFVEDPNSLRGLATQHNRLIGVAVDPDDMAADPQFNQVLAREFNVVAIKDWLKLGLIRQTPYEYNFAPADQAIDFALQHGMQVRGVTLAWYAEVPDWVFEANLSRDQAMALLEQNIKTVVGRYKGRIKYWDVVNEAINDDGTGLRDSIWLDKIGPEYIDLAFKWAHEADPDAKLFYNDYNAEGLGAKSDAVYKLVTDLKKRGVPIDGVGLQGHFALDTAPSRKDVETNIERIAGLGLEVQFTEVDVRLQTPVTYDEIDAQARLYASMMQACLDEPACTAFVTWGLTDKFSWINDFLHGYADGLLFDDNYVEKPAYWAIHRLLSTGDAGLGSLR